MKRRSLFKTTVAISLGTGIGIYKAFGLAAEYNKRIIFPFITLVIILFSCNQKGNTKMENILRRRFMMIPI